MLEQRPGMGSTTSLASLVALSKADWARHFVQKLALPGDCTAAIAEVAPDISHRDADTPSATQLKAQIEMWHSWPAGQPLYLFTPYDLQAVQLAVRLRILDRIRAHKIDTMEKRANIYTGSTGT